MIKYVFKDSPLTIKASDKANAQKIGEALAKIAETAGGQLTPSAVVEAARKSSNVLHKHFEWDDTKAAQQWRVEQARSVIQCIHAEDRAVASGHVRAFVSIATNDGRAYHTIAAIKESVDLQSRVLEQADRDLEAFERRYNALQDVCAVVREAREILRAKRTKKAKTETRVGT